MRTGGSEERDLSEVSRDLVAIVEDFHMQNLTAKACMARWPLYIF